MNHEYACIEQLDLAAAQLATPEPSYARFALILTDNIIELMLYKKCDFIFVRDDGWFVYGNQFGGKHEYDAELRAKVLGRHFDQRPRFCRRIGVLSEDELKFILTAHEYRNEVYHIGLRHDDILYAIAWQYHELACDIFQRLSPLYRVWSSNDIVSDTVARHAGPEGIRIGSADDDVKAVADSLRAMKPSMPSPFQQQLNEAAMRRIEDFDGTLYWMSDDLKIDESDLLADVQFHDALFNENSPHLTALSQIDDVAEFKRYVQRERAAWNPPMSSSPVERWKRRAGRIRSEKDPLRAMEKFQSLLVEIEPLAELVFEAARQRENAIQLEIDTMRGK